MRTLLALLAAVVLVAGDSTAFATWTGDPCTTLTVRVLAESPPAVMRARRAGGEWQAQQVAVRPVLDTGWSVAECTVTGLKPDEKVEFDDGAAPLGAWRTLRDRLDPPLRLAIGGDMLHEQRYLEAVCTALAPADPEAAVIGGDWAYDNAESARFSRYHTLLGTWAKTMRRADGSGVPMIAAVGNHELGKGRGTLPETPFGVLFPEPMTRAVDIGAQVSFLLLNTNHGRAVADQTAWLQQALAERKERTWRFAVYHVPGYPSVRKYEDGASPQVRKLWVPLFERGGVAVGFENHDHALKRTVPLLADKPDPAGITYLGDGAWGVGERKPATPEERPYLAMSAAKRHAWIVSIGEKSLSARAIGEGGVELDRVDLAPRQAQ